MAKVEIGQVARHQRGIRQARIFVVGREARDRQCLGHRFLDRGRRQVGRARGALALAGVNGDAEAAIALVFEGLDLAEAHRHRQSGRNADAGLGGRRATRARQ
jgi:hypothetical protein